jgi:hypothetical protein
VQLGSGTGALGISLAMHGADVTVTDAGFVCSHLIRRNLDLPANRRAVEAAGGCVQAQVLEWGGVDSAESAALLGAGFDLVVAVECCYELDPACEGAASQLLGLHDRPPGVPSYDPLLRALAAAAARAPAGGALLAVANRERSAGGRLERAFLAALKAAPSLPTVAPTHVPTVHSLTLSVDNRLPSRAPAPSPSPPRVSRSNVRPAPRAAPRPAPPRETRAPSCCERGARRSSRD